MARLPGLIANLQKKGCGYAQILLELQKQGFTHTEITKALQAETIPILRKTITAWQRNSYTKEQITKHLQSYGYPDFEIKAAFPIPYLKPMIGITSILIIIIIVLLGLSVVQSENYTQAFVNTVPPSIEAGTQMSFHALIQSEDSTAKIPVTVNTKVIDTTISNIDIFTAIGTTNKQIHFVVPETTTPGDYVLETTITFGKQEKVFTSNVIIIPSVCIEDWDCSAYSSECPASGALTRTCIDISACGTQKSKPVTISFCTYKANNKSEFVEVEIKPPVVVQSIIELARSNVSQARELCLKSSKQIGCYTDIAVTLKDVSYCRYVDNAPRCVETVAEETNDVALCSYISSDQYRDECYMQFVSQLEMSCNSLAEYGMRLNCLEIKKK